jgi:hypothetical protein
LNLKRNRKPKPETKKSKTETERKSKPKPKPKTGTHRSLIVTHQAKPQRELITNSLWPEPDTRLFLPTDLQIVFAAFLLGKILQIMIYDLQQQLI